MSIYNPNVPQPNDDLSDSQGQILQNFQKANSSFGIDHYTFADLTVNNGFHQRVTFPGNATAPTPGANYGAYYAVTNASNETWSYWRRDGSITDMPALPVRVFGQFNTNPLALNPNSFGISTVALVATGRYKVTFSVPFPNGNYSVLTSLDMGTPGSLGTLCILSYGNRTPTDVEIQFLRIDGTGYSTLLPGVSMAVLRNDA